jgi:hypothetical protein
MPQMGRTSQNRRNMPSGYFDSENSLTSQYRRYMPAGDSGDEDSCEERGIWVQSLKNGSGRTNKPDRATNQSHNSNILAKLQDTRQYIDEVTSFFALRSLTYLLLEMRKLYFAPSAAFFALNLFPLSATKASNPSAADGGK